MQINEYPVEATYVSKFAFFDIDKDLSPGVYQSQKIQATNVLGSFIDYLPELLENIYTVSSTLSGNREVAQDGFDMAFTGGQFMVGTTSSVFPFRMQVSGNDAGVDSQNGIYISSTGNAIFAGSANGNTIVTNSGTGRGFASYSPANIIRKDAIGLIPAIDPSSIWDVYSDDQGSRPFPANANPKANISSPADGLISHDTTLGYPAIKHPVYDWQYLGYGAIRLTIDFSSTPLNSGNAYKINIPTQLPINTVIHKIVGIGFSIEDPVGGSLAIGTVSDNEYFAISTSALNSNTGSTSIGNSKRTLSTNENFVIEDLEAVGVSSGVLTLTIYHT